MNEKQKKLREAFKAASCGVYPEKAFKEGWGLVGPRLEGFYFEAYALLADEPVKELKDYTLAELAGLVHDMAREKGWWDAPREWSEIACLIHSEISEAVECYRNGEMAMHVVDGKPEGLVVELADVLIRCLDYLQSAGWYTVGIGGDTVAKAQQQADGSFYAEPMDALYGMHSELMAVAVTESESVALTVWAVLRTAARFNLDLQSAVVAKIEYNAKRPYRHGGKKA